MHSRWIVFLMTGFLLLPQAHAVLKSRALPRDKRLQTVSYQEDNVVPVTARPFITTQITFNKDEVIENIQSGDADAWTVRVDHNMPYMLFLKPTVSDSKTNMTVITDKHTYYFTLTSTPEHSKLRPTFALHFSYPDNSRNNLDKQLALAATKHRSIAPKSYHWDYQFNGDKRIMPLQVFDDGHWTYFQLRENQKVPAIFAVNNREGNEALVNVARQGNYLIVKDVAPQFTLRQGKHHVASIFNRTLIQG